jgi:hypothetical protein
MQQPPIAALTARLPVAVQHSLHVRLHLIWCNLFLENIYLCLVAYPLSPYLQYLFIEFFSQ